jgi:hypothetical protein
MIQSVPSLHRIHFAKTFYAAVALLIACVAFTIVWFYLPDENAAAAYQQLVLEANPVQTSANSTPYSANQHRQGIVKDVYYNQDSQRLQLRILSAKSVLSLDYHEQQTEVVEKMEDVSCCMQEMLYYLLPDGQEAYKKPDGRIVIGNKDASDSALYKGEEKHLKPMQLVRYLEAERAVYHYKSDKLIAEQVKVYRYALPGHTIAMPSKGLKPLMSGVAESVQFSLGEQDFQFKANKLKASFLTPGRSP